MLALFLAVISTTLARGDSAFVDVEVALSRAPSGAIEAAIANARSPKEVKLAPYVQATLSGRSVKLTYAVRAAVDASPGTYRMFAVLEIRERGGAPLATANVDQVIEVVAPSFTLADVDAWKKSYLEHQAEASDAYEKLHALHDTLRLDRADPPPPADRVRPADVQELERFLQHRLRADIEARRLRAAVDASDPAIAQAALMAIGAFAKRPTGTAAKASAIEGETIGRSLELTLVALNDARIDDAEAFLDKLTTSGRLDKTELARGLAMLGAVYAVRGRAQDSEKSFGRALCIDPKIDFKFDRALYQKRFDAARASPMACKQVVSISEVTATRVEGKTILIRAVFGPDPFQLIGGGDVEVWGSGGGVHRAEKVRAQGTTLEASIEDTGDMQTYDGQLLLRVLLRDVSGVPIATFGDPDPKPVPITGSSGGFSLDLPWWAWAVAAGVVAVGATATAVVVTSDRDIRYGIGPINAQF